MADDLFNILLKVNIRNNRVATRSERIRPMSDKDDAENCEQTKPVGVKLVLDGTTCLFCNGERRLKPNCTKQRWKVCNSHFMVTCPICGHEAFWLEGMKSGDHYACFSLSCNWVDKVPHNISSITGHRPSACGGYRYQVIYDIERAGP